MISNTVSDVTEVNWVAVHRQRCGVYEGAFPEMGMKALLTITTHPKKGTVKRELAFRLGAALIVEMGWELGDNILVCYDRDDVHSMMLMKHPKGSRLGREGGKTSTGKIYRLTIQAPFMTCNAFRSVTQVYRMDKTNKRLFVKIVTEE